MMAWDVEQLGRGLIPLGGVRWVPGDAQLGHPLLRAAQRSPGTLEILGVPSEGSLAPVLIAIVGTGFRARLLK